jgi:cytochrome b subunit of formate dehydrogenase
MTPSKNAYLYELKRELVNNPQCEELLTEVESHISEMLLELMEYEGLKEDDAMVKVVNRIGSPENLAKSYKQEMDLTPKKIQWTFISVNILFFISGIFLTAFYNVLSIPFLSMIWSILTSITTILILLYMLFWVLLGYEIGKEFGLGGKLLLKKTFYFALVPNLILMALVVFQLVPASWFDPLLSPSFIVICILCTTMLYPISYAAFRWGTLRSI